ncbi:MAG: hypothetical protein DHS20C01_13850 [marine bacterium B5-7]|nr:MAG: hypothetical protein DHS20C01_13850 [marine bacterium B5-7]
MNDTAIAEQDITSQSKNDTKRKIVVVFSHHREGGGKPLDSLWFATQKVADRGIKLIFPWTGGRITTVLKLLFKADYIIFDGVWSTILWRGPLYLFASIVLRKKLIFYWHETDWHIRGKWPYDKTANRGQYRGKEYIRRLPTLYAFRRNRFTHLQLSHYGCRLLEEVVGVPKHKVKLLRNMTRSSRLLEVSVPGTYQPGLIIACGHVKANKRPDIFLDVAKRLSINPLYHFLWIGKADRVFDIEGEVRKRQLGSSVEFKEWTANPQLEIAKANVFVHPSEFEGMPKVLMEALALGKPVVAFDVGGIKELLGGHGHVLPFGDVDGFVKAIEESVDDMSESAQLERRRYYEKHFTEDAFAQRLVQILSEI